MRMSVASDVVMRYLLPLVLASVPAFLQQTVQLCPEVPFPDPSPFTCTSIIGHTWTSPEFTGLCPGQGDLIALIASSVFISCGMFTAVVTSVTGNEVTSSLRFIPTAALDGSTIQCEDGTGMLIPSSNFIIGINTENLQIMSITDSSLDCVTVVLQQPTDTTGIMSYTVVATLGNMDVSEGTSDDGDDLTVEVCGLSLCSDSYTFQARANGGGICPSELTSFTPTLFSVDQVANVRLGDGGRLEWDAPSNVLSAGCIIQSYTIGVAGSTITTATNATSELPDSRFDTCDSSLSITIGANVASIGLIGSSISDSFTPSSVFPSTPGEVTISGDQVLYTSNSIRVTLTTVTTDQRFPDAEFRIGYSGTQPGCVGSSQAQDDVASVVYSCLDDSDVTFNATYEDPPDCRSDTVTVQIPQTPLFPSIRLQPTVTMTSDSATVSYPSSTMVAGNNFNTVGTVFQSDGNTVVTSDTTTYPENVVFRDLVFNTSYRYILQVVSKDDSSIIIGLFIGIFDPTSSDNMKLTTSEAVGIAVVITFLVSFAAGGMVVGIVVQYYHLRKQKGKYFPREEPQQEPAPMCEDVSTHVQPQQIELKENVAYGQVQ